MRTFADDAAAKAFCAFPDAVSLRTRPRAPHARTRITTQNAPTFWDRSHSLTVQSEATRSAFEKTMSVTTRPDTLSRQIKSLLDPSWMHTHEFESTVLGLRVTFLRVLASVKSMTRYQTLNSEADSHQQRRSHDTGLKLLMSSLHQHSRVELEHGHILLNN